MSGLPVRLLPRLKIPAQIRVVGDGFDLVASSPHVAFVPMESSNVAISRVSSSAASWPLMFVDD